MNVAINVIQFKVATTLLDIRVVTLDLFYLFDYNDTTFKNPKFGANDKSYEKNFRVARTPKRCELDMSHVVRHCIRH